MTSKPPRPYTEERPWGRFTEFTKNEPSTVKIVTVDQTQALSLQSHRTRDEFWRVIEGEGFVTTGDSRVPAKKGDEFFIPRGTKHRIEAADRTISVLEISFGSFDESDIERFEDRYGRA
jgi:mannose-6-phosphate isomerase-like protein (cupin superfamily)